MTATQTHEIASTLNNLVQTCLDGQEGFETAGKAVDDNALQSELMSFSAQRRDFATDLQNLVASLGESPKESGSVSAALHRGWINLKTAVSSKDRYAVLAECERGEDSAVETYRKALESNLPGEYATTIRTQYDSVKRTHDRVKAMRDASKPS
ncbi:MAG TPA: PA2169 family four-helix-bundle protein [Tepidisphaeraceae bacterium]|mgnify:CR=1 FL=1|nr:PA2169 family four-helix-bundle protein [Tepidisphaeraceae bacterium]